MNSGTFAYPTSVLLGLATLTGACGNPHSVVLENAEDSGLESPNDDSGLPDDSGPPNDSGSPIPVDLLNDAAMNDGASACAASAITFDLTVDTNGDTCYFGWPYAYPTSSFGCPQWLNILGPDGATVSLLSGACVTSCAALPVATSLKTVTRTWDGTIYPKTATGDPKTECITPACAPAGVYVATMCAEYVAPDAGTGCQFNPPTCKQVSFSWPPSAPNTRVDVTISPTLDGG